MSEDSTQRDIGRLEARMAGLEDWTKSLSKQLDDVSKTLAAINNELSAAKGASRAVIGIAMMFGGVITWLANHFSDKALK